jgi:methylated-DNA-protein-cysteine methyltransferase-like protein
MVVERARSGPVRPPAATAGRWPVPSDAYPRIYAVVRRIPRGKVATYSQVARLADLVNGARQVGYALHALGGASTLPWHRVINSAGRISLPPEAGGVEQRFRLLEEGIMVDVGGRIPLKRHQWRPGSR